VSRVTYLELEPVDFDFDFFDAIVTVLVFGRFEMDLARDSLYLFIFFWGGDHAIRCPFSHAFDRDQSS
jgi:hypothetical protein